MDGLRQSNAPAERDRCGGVLRRLAGSGVMTSRRGTRVRVDTSAVARPGEFHTHPEGGLRPKPARRPSAARQPPGGGRGLRGCRRAGRRAGVTGPPTARVRAVVPAPGGRVRNDGDRSRHGSSAPGTDLGFRHPPRLPTGCDPREGMSARHGRSHHSRLPAPAVDEDRERRPPSALIWVEGGPSRPLPVPASVVAGRKRYIAAHRARPAAACRWPRPPRRRPHT